MTRKHIGLEIQHNGILVAIANKKHQATKIETFTIPLAGAVLAHGVVSNAPLLKLAFKTLINKRGEKCTLSYFVGSRSNVNKIDKFTRGSQIE